MKCPACYYEDTKVLDSRMAGDGFSIRRRRECLKCNFRYSTLEEIEILNLTIVKRDGKKENYDKDKIEKGLKKSLEKRPITNDEFKKLLYSIERDIQALKRSEVKSSEVGEVIMKHLKKIDQIAYIRFASVYRSFKDVETFQKELNKLTKKRKR